MVLATIGQRAVAKILDNVLLVLVLLPFTYSTLRDLLEEPDDLVVPFWLTALVAGAALAYDWLLVAWRGQTIGKMVMRIRVVDTEGRRVGFSRAGIRALVPTAVQLVPYGIGGVLLLVTYLWAVFDPSRQGLHDKAAGTLVVPAALS